MPSLRMTERGMGLLGRLVRLPLALVPTDRPRRVLSGPLRGAYWLPSSASHGCWLGTYERRHQRLLSRLVKRGSVVFDVGAHVGFFSLLAARLAGSEGHVVAFEPLPCNADQLQRHVTYNQLSNVRLLRVAVGERSGTAAFAAHEESSMGSLADNGRPVDIVAIDDLVAAGEIPLPDVVKVDVEGAELRVLHGGAATFARRRPALLLAAHGWRQWTECCRLLTDWGYRVTTERDGERDGDYSLMALPAQRP